MTGSANFNEVFLTDVRVPDSHRVGELNKGFGVIITTLGNERTIATRAPSSGRGIGPFERLVGIVDNFGDRRDPLQRQRLAQLYIADRIKELLIERWRAALKPGVTPGPEMSILKLHNCGNNIELVHMLTEVLGPCLAADTGAWVRSRGTSSCSPRPVLASAEAPRRSCGTPWGRRCSASRRSRRADGGRYQTRSTSAAASTTWQRTTAFATLPVAVFGSSSVT